MQKKKEDSPLIPIDTLMEEIRKEVAEKQSYESPPDFEFEVWYDFTAKGSVHSLLGTGWSTPEESYCWMVGPTATLNIAATEDISSFQLSVLAHPMLGGKLAQQKVSVFWNDRLVANWNLYKKDFYNTLVLNSNPASRVNTLKFECETPLSPQQSGENEDTRSLAMAVHGMSIKPF